jgi:hypothetical protein
MLLKPTPILHVGRFARVRHVCYLGRSTCFHTVEGWQGRRVSIWSRRSNGAFTSWELPGFR